LLLAGANLLLRGESQVSKVHADTLIQIWIRPGGKWRATLRISVRKKTQCENSPQVEGQGCGFWTTAVHLRKWAVAAHKKTN